MISDNANRWITIASNIGVFIGLVFVGIEVRNSSNAVTAQAATAMADGNNQYNFLVASDPELARIAHIGIRDPSKLTDGETLRAAAMLRGLLNLYRQQYTMYVKGAMPEEQWASTATNIKRVVNSPGAQLYLAAHPMFSADFYEELNRFDASGDGSLLGRDSLQLDQR